MPRFLFVISTTSVESESAGLGPPGESLAGACSGMGHWWRPGGATSGRQAGGLGRPGRLGPAGSPPGGHSLAVTAAAARVGNHGLQAHHDRRAAVVMHASAASCRLHVYQMVASSAHAPPLWGDHSGRSMWATVGGYCKYQLRHRFGCTCLPVSLSLSLSLSLALWQGAGGCPKPRNQTRSSSSTGQETSVRNDRALLAHRTASGTNVRFKHRRRLGRKNTRNARTYGRAARMAVAAAASNCCASQRPKPSPLVCGQILHAANAHQCHTGPMCEAMARGHSGLICGT